jgi:hypothetical protein
MDSVADSAPGIAPNRAELQTELVLLIKRMIIFPRAACFRRQPTSGGEEEPGRTRENDRGLVAAHDDNMVRVAPHRAGKRCLSRSVVTREQQQGLQPAPSRLQTYSSLNEVRPLLIWASGFTLVPKSTST